MQSKHLLSVLAAKNQFLSHQKPIMTMSSLSPTHLPSLENSLLSLFDNCKSMKKLKQIHSQTIKMGTVYKPIIQTKLISFCCNNENGDMNYARKVFDEITEPTILNWNTMLKGYSRTGCCNIGVSMYLEMLNRNVQPDVYTYPFLIKGFTRRMASKFGRELHCHVVKYGLQVNVSVQIALVNMYSLCGFVDMAHGIFYRSCKSDVVLWNSMISGYNRIKHYDEAVKLFCEMEMKGLLPNSITAVSVLSACSNLKDLECGKKVHKYVQDCAFESNLNVENALIDMYAACNEMNAAVGIFESMRNRDVISWTALVAGFVNEGQIDMARWYFDHMPAKDRVAWTAMINGYIRVNCFKEALSLFRKMQAAKVNPDEFTVVSLLTACAQLGALEIGEWVKTYIEKNKIKNDVFVGNALLDMYFKCGNVEKAWSIFRDMPRRDKFTWTTMIVGLAVNGFGEEALHMLTQMQENMITPDEVTYIGILCACTHAGMIDKGRNFFFDMITRDGIEPNVAHYGCMVDLLGKGGHLKEAYEVIQNMPMKPNSIVWGALLGACRLHKDTDLAEIAATKILELEPDNGAVYVLLCNIYAACKKMDKLRELRKIMMDRGIKKTPGCSSIEMNGTIHEFVAGDVSHPQTEEIHLKLKEMAGKLKLAGYSPDTSEVFLDIREEEKESSLYKHSEKLAMAFGLISSRPGVTIRIVKNLRMCVDCHQVAKLVSKLYDRELILRDRTRFHRFRNGSCSCKDYW